MSSLLISMTELPIFGAGITVLAYYFGVFLNKKMRTPAANPVLIADALIVAFLLLFGVPYENYQSGASVIELFLAPATAALGVKIYHQFSLLKKNWLPVLIGCAAGAAASMLCVLFMCRMLGLDAAVTTSLAPKSVTTAIAVPLVAAKGGITSITVIALMITGILGAALSPFFIKLFRVKNPISAGVAIGTSSHALGTTKAVELGEIEGAMSGIAIGVAGLITVIYSIFI